MINKVVHVGNVALCGAKTRQGGSCSKSAGWGTDHVGTGQCKLHGGSTPNGRKSAQKRIAIQEVHRFALPIDVDPATALLEEVQRTAGWVAYLTAEVQARGEDAIFSTTVNGDVVPSPLVALLTENRKHLVAVTSAALRAGVEERRVQVAERAGDVLAAVIKAILDDLNLTREQRALVGEVVPRHLRALAS